MEKLIEQEQEKPTKTRADKRTRRKNSFFPMQLINCTKKTAATATFPTFAFC